ncbi:MAG: thioesterase domain-containing protein [Candidatus Acidiferrales bacterium]
MQISTHPAELEASLVALWEELLNVPTVGLDEDFFDLGGDSIIAVRLFSSINKRFGTNLAASTLFETRTIRGLASLIQQANAVAQCLATIVPIRENGSAPALFVIAGISNSVLYFRDVAVHLRGEYSVYGIEPRTATDRYNVSEIEVTAKSYIAALQRIQPQGPYYLTGYCFGGIVAYEMALQMLSSGDDVEFLGLIDAAEPNYLTQIDRAIRDVGAVARYKERLKFILFGKNRLSYLRSRFAAKSFRFFHELGRTIPKAIGSIDDNNLFVQSLYRPNAYPGTVTILRAAERDSFQGYERLLGWGDLIRGRFEVYDVPGTHHTVLKDPNARFLAQKLDESIKRARTAKGPIEKLPQPTQQQEPRGLTHANSRAIATDESCR